MTKCVRSLSVVAVALLAGLAAACGGSPTQLAEDKAQPDPVSAKPADPTPTKAQAPKVTVANVGYAYDPGEEGFGSATVVALVENPSTDKVAVNVDFTAYDKAGKVLAQDTGDVIVGSKKTGATGTVLDVGEGVEIGRVTAEPDVFEHQADDNPGSVLEPSDVQVRSDEYGGTKVTGKITNRFKSNLRDYRIDAVCFKGDKIIGGGFTYADVLHRSGTVRAADVDVFVIGKPDRCELYGSVSGATTTE